jgi:hypothetical protein
MSLSSVVKLFLKPCSHQSVKNACHVLYPVKIMIRNREYIKSNITPSLQPSFWFVKKYQRKRLVIIENTTKLEKAVMFMKPLPTMVFENYTSLFLK